MAYSFALNTVYNHYLTTYSPMRPSQYDAHKKSELRSIYNSIVKLNKESPLFLINHTRESQEFAIGLKENARQLRNTIASLGGLEETTILNKKVAFSSNHRIAAASYVGSYSEHEEVPSFDISVTNLASGQINQGEALPAKEKIALPPGSYSFDINISDMNYEFQFHINEEETNEDIQNRLARLFNNADIGLTADVHQDENGNSALRLVSNATGISPGKNYLFQINDEKTSKTAGAVSYLGLNHIAQNPSNAQFLLNGDTRTALSNHFTVGKMYELTLSGVSAEGEEPVRIGLKEDTEAVRENVSHLLDGYNAFLQSSSSYLEAHPESRRFLNEMKGAANLYQNDMASLGIEIQPDGTLQLEDSEKLSEAFLSGGAKGISAVKDFTNSVLKKSNQISLNPMEYVDKKIVAYKKPGGRNFANPYITSAYSGMMFNSYC